MKNIIIFVLLFFSLIPVGIVSAKRPSVKGLKQLSIIWNDPQTINSDIDYAHRINMTGIIVVPTVDDLVRARAGNDPYKAGVQHAHDLGMSFFFGMVIAKYSNNDFDRFINNQPAVNSFINDLNFIVTNYDADGIFMEEPYAHSHFKESDKAVNQLFFNNFFRKVSSIVPQSMALGFVQATNNLVNVERMGIDIATISNEHLFSYFLVSGSGYTPEELQSRTTEWQKRLPDLEIIPAIFITDSGIIRKCKSNGIDGNNDPSCYNQGFFNQVRYDLSNLGGSFMIFHFGLAKSVSMSWFPAEQAVYGSNWAFAGDRLGAIIGER